jgi:hypothetical protein
MQGLMVVGVTSAARNIGLFALILSSIAGFGIGRWAAHFGSGLTVLVSLVVLVGLLFFHPHATTAHSHILPQRPFAFAAFTAMSLNLFSKVTIALTGLEQVACSLARRATPERRVPSFFRTILS